MMEKAKAQGEGQTSQLLSGAMMMSDARVKTPVAPTSHGIHAALNFLDNLTPREYVYNSPDAAPSGAAGSGTNLGVYAQDVEKGPGGGAIVQQDQQGLKRMDLHSLVGALAAGAGALKQKHDMHERRLSMLEAALGMGAAA
jgi:hypothetical protein